MAALEDGVAHERKCRRITKIVAQLIVDTRSYFDGEARRGERIDVSQPLKRTAACLGFGINTVKKTCKTLRDGVELPSDDDDEERNRERTVSKTIYPVVHSALFGMYHEKWHVTLDSLLKVLETQRGTHTTSWVWSRATLHRILTQEMSFTYGAHPNHYKAIKEKHSIALQHLEYIQHVRRYREEGRAVFYQDKTWVTKNMTPSSVWLDQGGDGGAKVPFGTGMQSIVCHVGNEAGFVPGAELIFRGKNALQGSDYHLEMNSSSWVGWRRKRFLPYRRAPSLRIQTSELVDWILGKAVKHEVDGKVYHTRGDYMQLKVVKLTEICKRHKPKPVFRAQVLAAKFDCMILFFPVSHPELNPIEMVWAAVKTHVAKKNTTFTLVEVERLTRERVHELGSAEWAKYVRHAVKVEDEYYDVSDDIPFGASEK